MKAGDVVIYSEGGREFNALVFGVHQIPDHLGEDGEPLVHLVVVDNDPPRPGIDKVAPANVKPEQKIRYIYDVVHESRAASAAGAGRYRECGSDDPEGEDASVQQ